MATHGAHEHPESWWQKLLGGHAHDAQALDSALTASERGMWAVKLSLLVLMLTALLQVVIVYFSGSVALLADTIHNFSDALTAVPLWLAFQLSRRKPNLRYAYGYGRAEDLAGALVVLMIFASTLLIFYESFQKLSNPAPLNHIGWVMVAAVIGFVGNEAVALFRIRVGREIGSAALEADGAHARVDGLTSLGVLVGALGVALGFPLADPLVGLLIGVVVLFVTRDAARKMWYRLMDAGDPAIAQQIETLARETEGVQVVHDTLVRWLGHQLRGELYIEVDADLSVAEGHQIAERVRHQALDQLPALAELTVHVEPCAHRGDPHQLTNHHAERAA